MVRVGEEVDRYVIEALLGAGGMAEVYRVRHRTLGTLHALKVLRLGGRPLQERLILEGRSQARLRHPNVVAVTDVLDVAGAPGLLMELVDGPTLEAWLRDGRPPVEVAERLFREVVSGVRAAHALGVVHRDLKPGNVLLASVGGGLVAKVTDFGLAKVVAEVEEQSPVHTRSGMPMGTPSYMAPEQVRDAASVDRRADVFSLGCILYELLTGRRAFDGPDVLTIYNRVAAAEYVPLEVLRPELPRRHSETIRACLALDRARRPEDAETLLAFFDGSARPGGGVTPGAVQPVEAGEAGSATWIPDPGERKARDEGSSTPPRLGAWPTMAPGAESLVPGSALEAPATEALPAFTIPRPANPGVQVEAPPSADPPTRSPPAPAGRWASGRWLAGLGILVLGGGGAWMLTSRVEGEPALEASSPSPSPPPPVPDVAPADPPGTVGPPAELVVVPATPAPRPERRPAAAPASAPPPVGSPAPSVEVAPATGTLLVNAVPYGEVYVDGARRGTTPLKLEIPAGDRRVRIVAVEGGESVTRTVSVTAGEVANLSWCFELGADCPP